MKACFSQHHQELSLCAHINRLGDKLAVAVKHKTLGDTVDVELLGDLATGVEQNAT